MYDATEVLQGLTDVPTCLPLGCQSVGKVLVRQIFRYGKAENTDFRVLLRPVHSQESALMKPVTICVSRDIIAWNKDFDFSIYTCYYYCEIH